MSAKKARKTRPKQPAAPAAAPPASTKPRAAKGTLGKRRRGKGLSPLEVQLRKALAEMGLARARRVFAAVEASFDD